MQTVSTISKVLMWISLVFTALIQGMVIFAIQSNNTDAVLAGQTDKLYNLVPLICASMLLLAGVILFAVLRKRRYIGVILAAVAAVVFVVVAFDIRNTFTTQIGATGETVGITAWRMIYRHISPVMVAVFMLIAWLCGRAADKAAAEAYLARGKTGYDLSGGPLFADEGILPTEVEKPAHRLKRSLRARQADKK